MHRTYIDPFQAEIDRIENLLWDPRYLAFTPTKDIMCDRKRLDALKRQKEVEA